MTAGRNPASSADTDSGNAEEKVTDIVVSGNGAVIWAPRYPIGDVEPMEDPDAFENVTGKVGYCIDVHVRFRTSSTMDVYLVDSSKVYSKELNQFIAGSSGINFSCGSSGGSYSWNGICSAVRVAVLEVVDGKEVLKCVWIPNDTYELTFDEEKGQGSYDLNGEPESAMKGYRYICKTEDGKMAYHTYTTEEYARGDVIVDTEQLARAATKNAEGDTIVAAVVNQAPPLLSFVEDGSMQVKELVLRIWIEGEDREAQYSPDLGEIGYRLNFVGIRKDAVELEEDALQYNGLTQQIEYADGTNCESKVLWSRDGIHWNTYGPGKTFPREDGTYTIYLKTRETPAERRSNFVTVEIPAKEN